MNVLEVTGGSTNILTEIVTFFKETLLPLATELVTWMITTDYVKYFAFIALIFAIIGIIMRIKRA